jgi:hypothetical protein
VVAFQPFHIHADASVHYADRGRQPGCGAAHVHKWFTLPLPGLMLCSSKRSFSGAGQHPPPLATSSRPHCAAMGALVLVAGGCCRWRSL